MAEDCSVRGLNMGVRRAFQLANIPIEGNQILGQEYVDCINAAVELPPHGAQDAQHRNEGANVFPVHVSAIPDSGLPCRRALPAPAGLASGRLTDTQNGLTVSQKVRSGNGAAKLAE